jgi:hypothetical protein
MTDTTLLLDRTAWDLVLDANVNLAVATEPYALAQDAASAIKLFLGEYYWDTTQGVPWLQQILGQRPAIALVKALLEQAAETVPDVASATVFISSFTGRTLSGQVQVTSASTGQTSAASFTSVSPQGL